MSTAHTGIGGGGFPRPMSRAGSGGGGFARPMSAARAGSGGGARLSSAMRTAPLAFEMNNKSFSQLDTGGGSGGSRSRGGSSRGNSRGGTGLSSRGGSSRGGRPSTASSAPSAYHIVALCENRHAAVGIAAINIKTQHELQVTHIADNKTFAETLLQLKSLAPTEVIMCESHKERALTRMVVELFAGTATKLSLVVRSYFDEDAGANLLERVTSNPISTDLKTNFTVMASVAGERAASARARSRLPPTRCTARVLIPPAIYPPRSASAP
jgi:hypothetical protein